MSVTDASKTVIEKVRSEGGSVELIHRTPLKLREHLYPEKFPLSLREPIPPSYTVKKLDRKAKDRGIEIVYKKP